MVKRGVRDGADLLYVDLHLLHEVTSPQAFDGLRISHRQVRRPNLTLAVEDHAVPTTGEWPIADIQACEMLSALRRNCAYFGIPLRPLALPGKEWKRSGIVHSLPTDRPGWPTLPFTAVIESFVLRQLREIGFTRHQIREAAEGIRQEFGDEYGLARPGIGHDAGTEICNPGRRRVVPCTRPPAGDPRHGKVVHGMHPPARGVGCMTVHR